MFADMPIPVAFELAQASFHYVAWFQRNRRYTHGFLSLIDPIEELAAASSAFFSALRVLSLNDHEIRKILAAQQAELMSPGCRNIFCLHTSIKKLFGIKCESRQSTACNEHSFLKIFEHEECRNSVCPLHHSGTSEDDIIKFWDSLSGNLSQQALTYISYRSSQLPVGSKRPHSQRPEKY
jgi:hypothetical protein